MRRGERNSLRSLFDCFNVQLTGFLLVVDSVNDGVDGFVQVRETYDLYETEGEGEGGEEDGRSSQLATHTKLTFMNWSKDFDVRELPLNRVRGFAENKKIKAINPHGLWLSDP